MLVCTANKREFVGHVLGNEIEQQWLVAVR